MEKRKKYKRKKEWKKEREKENKIKHDINLITFHLTSKENFFLLFTFFFFFFFFLLSFFSVFTLSSMFSFWHFSSFPEKTWLLSNSRSIVLYWSSTENNDDYFICMYVCMYECMYEWMNEWMNCVLFPQCLFVLYYLELLGRDVSVDSEVPDGRKLVRWRTCYW